MKNKFNSKGYLKKFLKKSRKLRDQQLMHPEREWAIGLVGAFLLLLFSISLSTYIYFKNQSTSVHVNPGEVSQVVYRESLVKEVLTIVNARSEKLQNLTTQGQADVAVEEVGITSTTSETEISSEVSSTTSSN